MMKLLRLKVALAGAICNTIFFGMSCAIAQITPDGTLPNNSIVTPSGSTFNITGGTIAGGNLFHSFSSFSVPTRGTAFFNNGVDIQNIISRVTGGSISNIDGIIRANGTANVFLINPNGIIFGPNASLNVGGSFVASTANGIQFGNLGFFSATNPEAPSPLLTINPSALLFNQMTAAPIQNNSIAPAGKDPAGLDAFGLRVADGKSLLLVGGNINMDGGQLNAYGGRVELGGLSVPGNVGLNVDGDKLSLDFPASITRADVSLTNGAGVSVQAAGGGSIAINARNLEISGRSVLSAGIGEGLGSVGAVAGDITLNAQGEIKILRSNVVNDVNTRGMGNAGNITATTLSFFVSDTELSASTSGKGDAGSIIINASDTVSFDKSDSYAFSGVEKTGVGKGGDIRISADSLSVTNGAQLQASTLGQGSAGNVIINAHSGVSFDGASSNGRFPSAALSTVEKTGVGKGGDIRISADSLSVTNGAQLQASTLGQGSAGNVIIDARDRVSFDGAVSNGRFPSAAVSTVEETGVGKGGDIHISADSLSVANSAQLLALTRGKGDAGSVIIDVRNGVYFDGTSSSGISPSAALSTVEETGVGKGGDIRISADSLSVTNGAQLQVLTRGKGDAGNMTINTRNGVYFDGTSSSGIAPSAAVSTVEKTGVGKGGDIHISADSLSVTNGAELETPTFGQGSAGNVIIDARGKVSFDGTSSNGRFNSAALTTVEKTGVGKGGDIHISADSLSVTNGADLEASTFGQGSAGNVIIDVRGKVSFDGSSRNGRISSTAFSSVDQNGVGKGGDIRISADSLSVTNGAQLLANTLGRGDAGNVIIDARNSVSFDGSSRDGRSPSAAVSTVEQNGVGKGGDIHISADSLSVTNGAQLQASTFGQGSAGNVIIDARGGVSFDGTCSNGRSSSAAFSAVEETGVGKGGDIHISADNLSVTNGAELKASTFGQGSAGNVIVDARGRVSFDGTSSNGRFPSTALSTVGETGVGKGGDIHISADSLSVTNGAQLLASTLGQGSAGNVIIDARGRISFDGTSSNGIFNSAALSTVEDIGVGKGGDIHISADSLSVTNGAQLEASTFGQGSAGNVIIDARGRISFDGTSSNGIFNSAALSTVEDIGVGKGGDIHISADSLSVTNGAQLEASTFGQGSAGNVIIDARGRVSFDGSSSNGIFNSAALSRVAETGVGKGGDIHISADSLSVTNGAQFAASTFGHGKGGDIHISADSLSVTNGAQLEASTFGQGSAGNVIIDARGKVSFDGGFRVSDGIVPSGVMTTVGIVEETPPGVGKGGDIRISADSLSVTNGAELEASTYGQGSAGNVIIDARGRVSFDGTSSNGVSPSAALSKVQETGVGKGGDIHISADSLSVTNGAQLEVSTLGKGDAGNVIIDARGRVAFDGTSSNGRFPSAALSTVDETRVGKGGVGKGGAIDIIAGSVALTNGAQLSARNRTEGGGNAGNVTINARDTLELNNGSISTNAVSVGGGDITITAKDIRLRNNSLIRTDLSRTQGSGGNITLSANTILALENSDILAFAPQGKGGNITFNTRVFLSDPLYRPSATTTDPVSFESFRNNGRVDVNASGAVSGTISGVPDSSFIQNSLTELPQNLIDPNVLIANSCIVRSQKKQLGTFTITGAGGLPNRPGDVSASSYPTGEVRSVLGRDKGDRVSTSRPWHKGDPIVEPQGVYQLPSGHLVLSRECGD